MWNHAITRKGHSEKFSAWLSSSESPRANCTPAMKKCLPVQLKPQEWRLQRGSKRERRSWLATYTCPRSSNQQVAKTRLELGLCQPRFPLQRGQTCSQWGCARSTDLLTLVLYVRLLFLFACFMTFRKTQLESSLSHESQCAFLQAPAGFS